MLWNNLKIIAEMGRLKKIFEKQHPTIDWFKGCRQKDGRAHMIIKEKRNEDEEN